MYTQVYTCSDHGDNLFKTFVINSEITWTKFFWYDLDGSSLGFVRDVLQEYSKNNPKVWYHRAFFSAIMGQSQESDHCYGEFIKRYTPFNKMFSLIVVSILSSKNRPSTSDIFQCWTQMTKEGCPYLQYMDKVVSIGSPKIVFLSLTVLED